ncbi:hypothetical protein ATK74_1798 [Propionicimonas paludicola]|uniref:Uncharacterized protein n=1 Tax=Propionicimonas paludicola TaxID=185243 RepID=A0A2A9CT57_9ACTN|nr:hypothetical protein [Propionicimonas paludicola]PFG17235.1 hypothetical protein ATK74_1798 [Propionicimonas paludicola]
MSADVWIVCDPCPHCGRGSDRYAELNITYNLSPMLKAAGFCGWGDLVGMKARDAGAHVLKVLDGMSTDPAHWRAMNPPNGWGDYDRCLQGRMREWAKQCLEAGPDDTIGGWL